MSNGTTFSGHVRVASRIIDLLSSGLYRSPAACLKELVNNSYDANATRVDVLVKPDAELIVVQDNGDGMSKIEFTRHFSRISESYKRDGAPRRRFGRHVIGKIGIGFIAANELCDTMEIFSTQRGSTVLLHVMIDFKRLRGLPVSERRVGNDVAKGDYEGEILEAKQEEHYTQVFLKNVRGEARKILAGVGGQEEANGSRSLYGLSPRSVVTRLRDRHLTSWSQFDLYTRTQLQVALNVPIRYHKGWMPEEVATSVRSFESDVKKLNFALYYDGAEVRKPIVFSASEDRCFVRRFTLKGRSVSAKGYIYVQHGVIRPQELNGLMIRIRHAGLGEYDSTFLGFPSSEGTLFQRWMSAEIWADDRLEEAMNIDRRTLRITHPAFVELQEAVHRSVSQVIREARERLYERGSQERRHEKTGKEMELIEKVAENVIAPRGPKTANRIVAAWQRTRANRRLSRRLLVRLSVAAVYRLVAEVGSDVMSAEQLRKFLWKLTKRLIR